MREPDERVCTAPSCVVAQDAPQVNAQMWPTLCEHTQSCFLQRAVQRTSSTMQPQNVANTLWAYAMLQLCAEAVSMLALLHVARVHAIGMTAQNVANTLWALSELGVALASPLQTALLEALQRTSLHMTSHGVTNTWLAFARLLLRPSGSMQDILLAAAERSASALNKQGLPNLVWALGVPQLAPPKGLSAALALRGE